MAEEKESEKEKLAKNKVVYLLIRGVTDPKILPSDVKISKKEGVKSGDYLSGLKHDMLNMQQYVEPSYGSVRFGHNQISSNNLTKDTVLKEIYSTCVWAKSNEAAAVVIYYTGHGCTGTGDWVFKKSVVTLNDVISTVCTSIWGNKNFQIVSDCCYSGNWAFNLAQYKNKLNKVSVLAACYPGKSASDSYLGGKFTLLYTGKKAKAELANLQPCVGTVEGKNHVIDYNTMNITGDEINLVVSANSGYYQNKQEYHPQNLLKSNSSLYKSRSNSKLFQNKYYGHYGEVIVFAIDDEKNMYVPTVVKMINTHWNSAVGYFTIDIGNRSKNEWATLEFQKESCLEQGKYGKFQEQEFAIIGINASNFQFLSSDLITKKKWKDLRLTLGAQPYGYDSETVNNEARYSLYSFKLFGIRKKK
eukprot:386682_1